MYKESKYAVAIPPSQKFSVLNQCFTFFNQNIIITSSLGELYAPRKALPPLTLLTPAVRLKIPVESLGPKGRTLISRHTPLLEPTTPLGLTLPTGKFPMEHFYPKPSRSMGQYLISKTPLLEQFQTPLLEHSRHAPLLVDASHLKQTRQSPLKFWSTFNIFQCCVESRSFPLQTQTPWPLMRRRGVTILAWSWRTRAPTLLIQIQRGT